MYFIYDENADEMFIVRAHDEHQAKAKVLSKQWDSLPDDQRESIIKELNRQEEQTMKEWQSHSFEFLDKYCKEHNISPKDLWVVQTQESHRAEIEDNLVVVNEISDDLEVISMIDLGVSSYI